MMYFARIDSPMGKLLAVGEERSGRLVLRGLYFVGAPHARGAIPKGAQEDASVFADLARQLEEYFAGKRRRFSLGLGAVGTEFQRAVWDALVEIPYGEVATYAEVARRLGRPNAVRAVGAANGKNPLSIVVPCHRVIGKDGTLTGYAGGLANKRRLLALEAARSSGARAS